MIEAMRTLMILLITAGMACAQQSYDLVVYGGTAGGVMTAVAGARQGLKTVLVNPGNHIGGMVSGGLSGTDTGRKEVVGGLSLEFYFRGRPLLWPRPALAGTRLDAGAKVAESIMREMLKERGVTLVENHRLREKSGVRKDGAASWRLRRRMARAFRARCSPTRRMKAT